MDVRIEITAFHVECLPALLTDIAKFTIFNLRFFLLFLFALSFFGVAPKVFSWASKATVIASLHVVGSFRCILSIDNVLHLAWILHIWIDK